ncbi:MAG: GTPase Era [bacterium]
MDLASVAPDYKTGFVAVVGKPNVGKSTLINALVGQKVSAVSSKPQTTRRRVLGILTLPKSQVIFVDTPGIHQPHNKLGQLMIQTAQQAVTDGDVILFMVDGSRLPDFEDRKIAQILNNDHVPPVILVMNKMDKLKAERVESNVAAYQALVKHVDWMMTTALRKVNLDKLLDQINNVLPEGPPLFEEDQVTDQSMRIFASELIREKVLHKTRQEVPHSVAVLVELWEERTNGVVHIGATIYVEKDSQKGILIGQGGIMLKQIGQLAREEIEEALEQKVYLELWVKVRRDWRQDPNALRSLEFGN